MRRSVLITGVSGSIGLAIAKCFVLHGYDVIATYYKHQIDSKLEEFCKQNGANLQKVQLDICDPAQVEKVFAKAFRDAKYLDCVVCNSGISLGEKMLCDNSDEEIEKIIRTNLIGTIYCNREASKHMLSQKHGNIINTIN